MPCGCCLPSAFAMYFRPDGSARYAPVWTLSCRLKRFASRCSAYSIHVLSSTPGAAVFLSPRKPAGRTAMLTRCRECCQHVLSVPGDGFSSAGPEHVTRACWLCVRIFAAPAFSLAPPLRYTGSAAAEAALFARFLATSGQVRLLHRAHRRLRPSRQRLGHDRRGRRCRSPGSRAKGFCACQGLRRHGLGMCLAISTPAVLPSVGRKNQHPELVLRPSIPRLRCRL